MALCECGCGNPVSIAKYTDRSNGWIKGQPKRFLPHHHSTPSKENHWNWKGGKKIGNGGYILIKTKGHPRGAKRNDYVQEHIIIVERILGKPLPKGVVPHHYGKVSENHKIVICENAKYHHLLHIRTRALIASGHADWRKCTKCKQWDKPENLKIGKTIYHKECIAKYFYLRRHGLNSQSL